MSDEWGEFTQFISHGSYGLVMRSSKNPHIVGKFIQKHIDNPTVIYSMKTILCWIEQLFSALCWLKKFGFIHRDITPQNVLVSSASDVYAVGLIIWEMIERKLAYCEYDVLEQGYHTFFNDLCDGKCLLEPPNCSQAKIQELVLNCTAFHDEFRPEVEQSLHFVRELSESYSAQNFQPIIDPEETRKIRPIGFACFEHVGEKTLV
ncbi:unnamed protein product, partial [Mesorhabditis belari]|uniref:Protein kinase domain-containing protein n=1 Tax=Mesorhabditis belari TaxID=2138241 RepID=A0AAF3FAS0_9BILA